MESGNNKKAMVFSKIQKGMPKYTFQK